MRVRWFGRQATDQLRRHLFNYMREAGKHLLSDVRKEFSVPGPPRSLPGDAPHIDTSALIQSYFVDVAMNSTEMAFRVGATVPYVVALELGTSRMAPRPHLVPTLVTHADDIARTILRP
jgi:hypothetical protein